MSVWSDAEKPRRAVIVGINKYADRDIPELTGAERDAEEMCDRLRRDGEFEIADNHFLIGPDATSKAIRRAISDLLWDTDKCYLSIFYFSGHGFQDGYENTYLAPYDMVRNEPFVSGVNMEELKQVFLRARNKDCALLILDCCYSGILAEGTKAIVEVEAPFEKHFGTLEAETKTGTGKIVLTSSGKDEKSREVSDRKHSDGTGPHPHGIFTFHLLEGLDGGAADDAGVVTAETLRNYIDEHADKGAQKPKYYLAETSGAGFIRIAVASSKYNTYVGSRIAEAERWHETKEPGPVFEAISGLSEVLQRNPREPRAIDLKAKINETLMNYSREANRWWSLHDMEVRRKFDTAYRDLDKVIAYLDFDAIVALDPVKRALLKNLCRVSLGEWDTKRFIQSCEPFDNPTGSVGGAKSTPSPPSAPSG